MSEQAKCNIITPNADDKIIAMQALPSAMESMMFSAFEVFMNTGKEIAIQAEQDKAKASVLTTEIIKGFTTSYINRFMKENIGDMLQQSDDLKVEFEFPEQEDKVAITDEDKDFVKKIVDRETDNAFKPGGGMMIVDVYIF